MGYEVHITRKGDWFAKDGPVISEAEWRSYVAADPELVMTGVAEVETPDGMLQITDPLLTEWRGHPGGTRVWISYFKGNLSIKNPDDECLEKMRRIATALQARVQGDDGEFYDGESVPAKSDQPEPFIARVARLFGGLFKTRTQASSDIKLDFDVGDRVTDTWGNRHTVVAIQRTANHGTGIILTRRDDGQGIGHAMFAHDLKRIDADKK